MKVISYARVSTDDKDQNPERQHMQNRRYADMHGHEVILELSEYITGDSNPYERPELKEALDKNREIEAILFTDYSRWTRQEPIKLMLSYQEAKDRGLKLISVSEPVFNMESEFGHVFLYIVGTFNNYYLKELSRNTKAGMERARNEGKQIGRPKAKFNKYRLKHLLSEGVSYRDIAEELDISIATISRFKRGME